MVRCSLLFISLPLANTFLAIRRRATAVLLTNTLVRDYLLNYARPLIYTTALSNANIVAASCSFDMLENGVAGEVSFFVSLFSGFCQLLFCLSVFGLGLGFFYGGGYFSSIGCAL